MCGENQGGDATYKAELIQLSESATDQDHLHEPTFYEGLFAVESNEKFEGTDSRVTE